MQYAYNSMKYIYNYFVTQYSYMTMDEFYKDNRFLVRNNNIVLDLSELIMSKEILSHPGGVKTIINSMKQNIVTHFNFHSKKAQEKIMKYKIGYII
jgi:hypothetical protein